MLTFPCAPRGVFPGSRGLRSAILIFNGFILPERDEKKAPLASGARNYTGHWLL